MPRISTKAPPLGDVLRETLADEAHKVWIKWMVYLSSKVLDEDSKNVMGEMFCIGSLPQAVVDRWKRQMATPYPSLPPKEQASDKEQADIYIHVVLFTIKKIGLRAFLLRLAKEAKKVGDPDLEQVLREARGRIE